MFLGLAIALAVWCALDVQKRALVDPARPDLHMTDVTVYTEAGRAFFDGRDPYEVANLRGWKYLYPPLFALLISPLAYATPAWQASGWFALSALMCFGVYFECRKLLAFCLPSRGSGNERSGQTFVPIPAWLTISAAVVAGLPALNCLQRGQMGIALVYPLLVGFRLVVTGSSSLRWFCGGVLLALPVALKLTPALPVACVLFVLFVAAWAGRGLANRSSQWSHALWPTAGCVAGSALFLLVIPASLVGWDKNLDYLHTWYEKVGTKVNDVRTEDFAENVDSPRNQSLSNAVYRCGNWVAYQFFGGPYEFVTGKFHGLMPMDAPVVSQILLVVRCLALLTPLGVAVRAARSRNVLLWGAALGLAAVATLVVAPVARGHYFVLVLPAVLFVPLWLIGCGQRGAALRAALIPAVLIAAHYLSVDYVGRVGVLGIGITIWYFTACGRIVFGRVAVQPDAGESKAIAPMTRAA